MKIRSSCGALVGGALLGVLLVLGCASEPPPPPEPGPEPFSGERAMTHLEKLVALGPRVAGTPADAEARALIRGELEALGLPVHEESFEYDTTPGGSSLALANLWTEIPGTHPGLFLIATPFDTAPGTGATPVGANEGASGAAVLLELARTLRDRPLPYTVRLLFLDGELLDPRAGFLGSEHAYLSLEQSGALSELRLLLYLHQVGDSDLEIHRDRLSDRRLRDAFFTAARRSGFAKAFPEEAPFDAAPLGQAVFTAHHFPHVVALADLRFGGTEIPGEYWRTVDDDVAHCSAGSLGAVGSVVRAGLESLTERQLQVDRVVAGGAHPQAPASSKEPAPASSEAPGPGEAAAPGSE